MNNGNNNLAKKRQMSDKYKNAEAMAALNENKTNLMDYLDPLNSLRRFAGNTGYTMSQSSDPRIANWGNNLYKYSGQKFINEFNQHPWDTTKNAYGALKGKLGFGQTTQSPSAISSAINTNAGQGANALGNAGNSGSAITNAVNGAGNSGSALSNSLGSATQAGQTGALTTGMNGAGTSGASAGASAGSSAMGAGGAALSGLSSVNNFAHKNYVDGGIDAASAAASFIPVYGWAVAAALQAGKMIKNMIKGKKDEQAQKAMGKAMAAGQQESEEKKQSAMEGLANNQQLQVQPLPTEGEGQVTQGHPTENNEQLKQSIFDAYKTPLSIGDEIAYQTDKANSPFANDSGSDYDLRGYWQKYGSLNPTATNGHLSDEFKDPSHPTFSNESKFYNGQPWAVDWRKQPYMDADSSHLRREDMTDEEKRSQDIYDKMNEIIENNKNKGLLKGSWGIMKDTMGYYKDLNDQMKNAPYAPQNEEFAGSLRELPDDELDRLIEERQRRGM